jgi:SAM-dependent methyltransferase
MNDRVEQHYSKDNLIEAVRDGLRSLGKDPANLGVADLCEIDQLHVRGLEATRDLAARLFLAAHLHLLDVGCGIGGPSRVLAADYGCRVTGIDLTEAYCRLAREMAGWVGLDHLLDYRTADALDLPFADGTFDAAWTQHAAMNIADKARLYGEIRRVLKPGGRFALYDVVRGPGGEVIYPVPWARESAISFLATPDDLLSHLEGAGFEIVTWRDTTAAGCAWFQKTRARAAEGGLPPVGARIFMGDDFADLLANLYRNLDEGRTLTVEVVCIVP